MTDHEVREAIRRRLAGIEHELLADPPTNAKQFTAAMLEITSEMIFTYGEPEFAKGTLADALKTLLPPRPASARARP